jgi:signal transduction histidine kinase
VTVEPVVAGARGGSVTVLVDDDGPGIPEADLERMFQPFQRLELSRNRETGGVGLGLPIARNIIRAHGGDVTLANRPGGGLRAMVVLPV